MCVIDLLDRILLGCNISHLYDAVQVWQQPLLKSLVEAVAIVRMEMQANLSCKLIPMARSHARVAQCLQADVLVVSNNTRKSWHG